MLATVLSFMGGWVLFPRSWQILLLLLFPVVVIWTAWRHDRKNLSRLRGRDRAGSAKIS